MPEEDCRGMWEAQTSVFWIRFRACTLADDWTINCDPNLTSEPRQTLATPTRLDHPDPDFNTAGARPKQRLWL